MTPKPKQELRSLSLEQIEQALLWLDNPLQEEQPKDLQELNPGEWFQLDLLLRGLQWEKEHNPLH